MHLKKAPNSSIYKESRAFFTQSSAKLRIQKKGKQSQRILKSIVMIGKESKIHIDSVFRLYIQIKKSEITLIHPQTEKVIKDHH